MIPSILPKSDYRLDGGDGEFSRNGGTMTAQTQRLPRLSLRVRLLSNWYACATSTGQLQELSASNVLQDAYPAQVLSLNDPAGLINGFLLAREDSQGNLFLPQGMTVEVSLPEDAWIDSSINEYFEPIAPGSNCQTGSGSGSQDIFPKECGVPCPPENGTGCSVLVVCYGSGGMPQGMSWQPISSETGGLVPYVGANQSLNLGTHAILAGAGTFTAVGAANAVTASNASGATTAALATGDAGLVASGTATGYNVGCTIADTSNNAAATFNDGTAGHTVALCDGTNAITCTGNIVIHSSLNAGNSNGTTTISLTTGWTLGSGWAYSGGNLVATTTNASAVSPFVPVIGQSYRIDLIWTGTTDNVILTCGGQEYGFVAPGTVSWYFTATSTAALTFTGSGSFSGTLTAATITNLTMGQVKAASLNGYTFFNADGGIVSYDPFNGQCTVLSPASIDAFACDENGVPQYASPTDLNLQLFSTGNVYWGVDQATYLQNNGNIVAKSISCTGLTVPGGGSITGTLTGNVTGGTVQALGFTMANTVETQSTSSYTALATDDLIVMNDASASTVSLIWSNYTIGKIFFIKNIGAGSCTLSDSTGLLLNGASSVVLNQYDSVVLMKSRMTGSPTTKFWAIVAQSSNGYSGTINTGPLCAIGSGTCTAGTTTTISNSAVTSTSKIFLQPTSSAFAALGAYVSAKTTGSFTVTTTTAAGTETFDYLIVNNHGSMTFNNGILTAQTAAT